MPISSNSFFETPDGTYSTSDTPVDDSTTSSIPLPLPHPAKLSIVQVNYPLQTKEMSNNALGLASLGLQRGNTQQRREGDVSLGRPGTGNSTSTGGSDSISPIKRKALSSFSMPKLASLTGTSAGNSTHNMNGDVNSSRPIRSFRGTSSSFVR